MNCKPGDLAVIISAPKSIKYQIGKIVKCVSLTHSHDGFLCWTIDPPIKEPFRTCVAVADKDLRPIRDPGDDARDETLLWKPVPTTEKEDTCSTS